jgi:uncharacterized protein (DUF362 family)
MKILYKVSNPQSIFFHLAGILCLIWFLVRVLPKPDRIYYPCQQVSMTIASSYIIFWSVIWTALYHGAIYWFRRARTKTFAILPVIAVSLFLIFTISSGVFADIESDNKGISSWEPIPNQPIGTPQGVNPGRVVWVWDPDATESKSNGYWWYKVNNDQDTIDKMFSMGVQGLAEVNDTKDAWDALFKHFNIVHGNGDIGYKTGEKISIKVNLNNCYQAKSYLLSDNERDASPYVVKALLRQLVNVVGVKQEDISIYDASRVMPNWFFKRVYYETYPAILPIKEFQKVNYIDNAGLILGREKVKASSEKIYFADDTGLNRTLPKCVVDAKYIFNMPLLKRHPIETGVTLSGKNLFGTWIENVWDVHNYHKSAFTEGNPTPQTDLLAHEHLGGKTLLYIGDGTYATKIDHRTIAKFIMYPFNNDWTNSLFFSQDPVAIDSVMYDFLHTEGTNPCEGSQNYLHQSAEPLPDTYDPENDGIFLSDSLGVHEHWNKSVDIFSKERYSGPSGNGIDFIAINGSAYPKIEIKQPKNGFLYKSGELKFRFIDTLILGDIEVKAEVKSLSEVVDKVEFYLDNELKFTDNEKPYIWSWVGGPILRHTIQVKAYYDETEILKDSIKVWKFIK